MRRTGASMVWYGFALKARSSLICVLSPRNANCPTIALCTCRGRPGRTDPAPLYRHKPTGESPVTIIARASGRAKAGEWAARLPKMVVASDGNFEPWPIPEVKKHRPREGRRGGGGEEEREERRNSLGLFDSGLGRGGEGVGGKEERSRGDGAERSR